MFVNTYYGSFNFGIYHIIWAWVFHGYKCPNGGILALFVTFSVLQGRKCSKFFSCGSDPN